MSATLAKRISGLDLSMRLFWGLDWNPVLEFIERGRILSPECVARCECDVEKTGVLREPSQHAFDLLDGFVRGAGSADMEREAIMRGNPGAVTPSIVRQEIRLGRMNPIGLADEMESELDVVSLAETSNRLDREIAIGIIDLVEEIDSMRRTTEASDEFATLLVEPTNDGCCEQ
jgi:hypothetical protein